MFTYCQFISAPFLDSDYNNTIDFEDKVEQALYFNKLTQFQDDSFDYQRKQQTSLKVGYSLRELKDINYVILINDDGTKYFYFIMDKQYVSEDTTMLILKMDLMQTYLNDYSFNTCLVEREHIKTNDILNGTLYLNENIINSVDEGLETGQYKLSDKIDMYNYVQNGCYIYTSSERLGTSSEPRPNITDDSGTSNPGDNQNSENYKNGYLNENGLVFLKSKEGYVANAYQDINGYWTIGYGVTQAFQPNYYEELYPYCTEQQASEVMGRVVYNFSSQVKINIENIGKMEWLNQDKLNALTSYAYQNGVGGLMSSDIWSAITSNKSDIEISNIWANLGSYTERRKQESQIFLGTYPSSMKITDHTNGGYVTSNNGKGYIPTKYK